MCYVAGAIPREPCLSRRPGGPGGPRDSKTERCFSIHMGLRARVAYIGSVVDRASRALTIGAPLSGLLLACRAGSVQVPGPLRARPLHQKAGK